MSQIDPPFPGGSASNAAQPAFQLRGSMLSITELELLRPDLAQLETQLAEKVAQAPNFFQDTPVVLALDKLKPELGAGALGDLARLCKRHGLHPVAVRTAHAADAAAAQALDLLVLAPSSGRNSGPAPAVQQPAPTPKKPPAPTRRTGPGTPAPAEYRPTKTIHVPIRSGQQVYAKGGDLIVLAQVSPGAELIADGNIHIYAPLRGRALAGARGDTEARIFCQQLSAELVSVAGQYKISEDLRRDPAWGHGVQISLDGDLLNITPL